MVQTWIKIKISFVRKLFDEFTMDLIFDAGNYLNELNVVMAKWWLRG